ncbi:MAG: ricin-type beta-trefoil lectin domain protein [Actinomycetota bacterium]
MMRHPTTRRRSFAVPSPTTTLLVTTLGVLTIAGCAGDDETSTAADVASTTTPSTAAEAMSPEPTVSATNTPSTTAEPVDVAATTEGASAPSTATVEVAAEPSAGPIDSGYVGRLQLIEALDDPAGYCLDVPGPATNLRLDLAAWAHSCHDETEPDQVLRFDEDGNGALRFLWEDYDLCLTADAVAAGSGFSYQPCDGGESQAFDATADGVFQLRGTDLCLAALNMDTGTADGDAGTGRDVAPGDRVRTLQLQPCATTTAALQQWVPIV